MLTPAPAPSTPEQLMLSRPTPGFWIGANMVALCDQALETLVEKARFYPGAPPEALLERLKSVDQAKRSERSDALTRLFDAPALARLLQERPGCPFASRFASWREDREEPFRIGWGLEPDPQAADPKEPAPIWGAIELCCSDCEFLAGPGDDLREPGANFYGREANEQAEILLSARSYCEAVLDQMEIALGLPPAMLAIDTPASRIRWGDDHLPSCLLPEHRHAALAARERSDIDSGMPPSAPAPRAPRI